MRRMTRIAAIAVAACLGGCTAETVQLSDADAGADAGEADADTDADGGGPDPGSPLFDEVGAYATTIAANGDPADVYYPVPGGAEGAGPFPVALLLQGAEVGRAHYAGAAGRVAAYGFVVVVPDHQSFGFAGPGLYAEQSEAAEVMAHMTAENASTASPVFGAVDVETLVLLGHSYGGLCGLNVVRGVCEPPTCVGLTFDRPEQLAGAAFYGTNTALPFVGSVISTVENDGVPVAFVQGALDGKALPADAMETYAMVQDPPKAYVGIAGANHYGMCDVNDPEGAQVDPNAPEIDQGLAVEAFARWSAMFLRAFALGDAAAREYVAELGDPADPNAEIVLEE